MPINISKFRSWTKPSSSPVNIDVIKIKEDWPDLSGYVFLVAPFHRRHDRHLFAGEGVVYKWNLKPQQQEKSQQIQVQGKKLDTWDSFWHSTTIPSLLSELLPEAFFPARVGLIGVGELANTAIVNLNDRLLLTADAGRYWEVEPNTLETITPIGYSHEHIVSIPLPFFPLIVNTAHPFYDPNTEELISCELRSKPRPGKLLGDMVSNVYITRWDGEGTLKHWELAGTELDGSPHTTIVNQESIMIPDMPFQIGAATLLGRNISPQKAYHRTQIYLVNRKDLERAEIEEERTVPSRLITFDGDSYHFLCNYYPDKEKKIYCVAVQQATISVSEAIKPSDVKHFSGEPYGSSSKYHGIPWMFAFDPGVLRKIIIQEGRLVDEDEEVFIHPGWFSTTLHTADPREQFATEGYSAIYQAYAGYHQDFICRRQYLNFRDHENRILTDKKLPNGDLPSVLAKVPLWYKNEENENKNNNWKTLTEKIEAELEQKREEKREQNLDFPATDLAYLGKDLDKKYLDFFVFPLDCLLDSVQFIPYGELGQGYIFTTVICEQDHQVWLFKAQDLHQGPIAKLKLPEEVNPGFTLHSEYFAETIDRKPDYNRCRVKSAIGSVTITPYKFLINRDAIFNRPVKNK